jgi:hypothetical protein
MYVVALFPHALFYDQNMHFLPFDGWVFRDLFCQALMGGQLIQKAHFIYFSDLSI